MSNKKNIFKHFEAYIALAILASGTIYAVQSMGLVTVGATSIAVYFSVRTIVKSFK